MKKLISFLIVTLMLTACSYKSYKNTIFVDYQKYNNVGFFMTESNSVSFDYIPVGSISTIVAGVKETVTKRNPNYNRPTDPNIRYSARTNRDYNQPEFVKEASQFSIYDAIDEMVNNARNRGADGIINLKIKLVANKDIGNGYEVSGMIIKRRQ